MVSREHHHLKFAYSFSTDGIAVSVLQIAKKSDSTVKEEDNEEEMDYSKLSKSLLMLYITDNTAEYNTIGGGGGIIPFILTAWCQVVVLPLPSLDSL